VSSIAVLKGVIYLGGDFSTVDDTPRAGLAAVGTTGGLLPWDPRPNGSVASLAVGTGALFVGGRFSRIGGKPRTALAAVDPRSGATLAFAPKLLPPQADELVVEKVAVGGGAVYATGFFRAAHRRGVSSFDAETGALLRWDPRPNDRALTVAVSSDQVAIGGSFMVTRGSLRAGLTAVDLSTGRILDWAPRFRGGEVSSVFVHGDRLFVGGSFASANGSPRRGIAVFDARSRTLESWRAAPIEDGSEGVKAFAVSGNRLLIGGDFSRIAGRARTGIAALDLRTGTLLDWNVGLTENERFGGSGTVSDLAVLRDALFLTGGFARVEDETRHGVAAVSLESGAVLTWDARIDPDLFGSQIDAIEVGENVIVGGWSFQSVAGRPRQRLAALDRESAALISPAVRFNEKSTGVGALALDKGRLFVGGGFSSVAGRPRQGLAALDPRAFALLEWQPDPARAPLSGVDSLAVAGDRLVSASFGTVAVFAVPASAG
jgi:hypothetical protein